MRPLGFTVKLFPLERGDCVGEVVQDCAFRNEEVRLRLILCSFQTLNFSSNGRKMSQELELVTQLEGMAKNSTNRRYMLDGTATL